MSLEQYVLVSQEERLVECFTRQEDGSWRLDRYADDALLRLESLDFAIGLDAVYSNPKSFVFFDDRESLATQGLQGLILTRMV